jgi:hypothetical protein
LNGHPFQSLTIPKYLNHCATEIKKFVSGALFKIAANLGLLLSSRSDGLLQVCWGSAYLMASIKNPISIATGLYSLLFLAGVVGSPAIDDIL